MAEPKKLIRGTDSYNPDAAHGPAMKALTERQQKFVIALLDNGGRNLSRAAADAGYSVTGNSAGTAGYNLAHHPKVQEALLEVSKARLRTYGLQASSFLAECIDNDGLSAKDRMRAALAIMDRTGLNAMTEHKTTIEHSVDPDALTERIRLLADKLNLDPTKLLGKPSAPILDAVTIPVPDGSEGLEDIL